MFFNRYNVKFTLLFRCYLSALLFNDIFNQFNFLTPKNTNMKEFVIIKRIQTNKSHRFQIDERGSYKDMERALLHYWRTWEGIKGAFTVMNGNELSVGLEHKNEVITYKVASYDQLDTFFKQL
jgi:hypothetical protein